MNKKVISLVLALVMVLGTFTSVFATEAKDAPKKEEAKKEETKKEETKKEAPKDGEKVEKIVGKDNKIQYIVDKKFVEGYADGSMGYDKNITRAEITRLLVLANGNEELAKQLQGSMKIYSDVDVKHWANGVISVGTTRPSDANKIAMLAGYPDKSFKPDKNVSYAELAKMLVVLVKKDLTEDMVKNAKWATSWLNWAAELGILEDVTIADSNAPATRADAFTMMYNALYKMVEFKREPANETRGIISELNKDKLILNEDSKKEYKITADTVFVEGAGENRAQIVKLWDVNARKLYLGSLVRVLLNEKNEVTHILQLGNPKDLAINNASATVTKDNAVWRGVADNTVETDYINTVTTLTNDEYNKWEKDAKSYVTVSLKDNYSSAKAITFHGNTNADTKEVTLRVTDKTEVYVANPWNNQMRKLNNINEALALIGFRSYDKNYKIPNVYAGFDVDGGRDSYKALRLGDARNTAKVIVFNVVSKDKGGDLYRVLNSASLNFRDTLEKTDGTLVDRNSVADTNNFPLNYGDHLDIIESRSVRTAYSNVIKLDHSDVRAFPIVEVLNKDGKYLIIKDVNGERSELDIRDADIFSAKRFDKLEDGAKIQFRVENHGNEKFAKITNVAEIISILPRDTKLEGSIEGIIPSVYRGQQRGYITEVNGIDTEHPTIMAKVDYNIFNSKDGRGFAVYNVSNENAKALKAYEGKDIKLAFKVVDELGWAGKYYATNFCLDDKDQTPIDKASSKSLIDRIVELDNKYNDNKVTKDNLADAKKEAEALQKEIDALGSLSKPEQKYLDPVKKVSDQVEVLEAKQALEAKIAEAKELAKTTKSTDGKDVEVNKNWATEAELNALTGAITTAESELSKTTKAELETAKTNLETAINTFRAAIKTGTKEASK